MFLWVISAACVTQPQFAGNVSSRITQIVSRNGHKHVRLVRAQISLNSRWLGLSPVHLAKHVSANCGKRLAHKLTSSTTDCRKKENTRRLRKATVCVTRNSIVHNNKTNLKEIHTGFSQNYETGLNYLLVCNSFLASAWVQYIVLVKYRAPGTEELHQTVVWCINNRFLFGLNKLVRG